MSGAELPSNMLWQTAAAGTDETDCNVGPAPDETTPTGSNGNCTSNWGVHDMVGNVWEWVGDWAQSRGSGEGSTNTGGNYGNDLINGIGRIGADFYGNGTQAFPMAWIRGGGFGQESNAGVFALFGRVSPAVSVDDVGFRCAK